MKFNFHILKNIFRNDLPYLVFLKFRKQKTRFKNKIVKYRTLRTNSDVLVYATCQDHNCMVNVLWEL